MRLLFALFATVVSLMFAPCGCAQTSPDVRQLGGEPVKSVLWVGNSFFYYNNSMHNHFGAISRADGAASAIRSVSVTISGSGFDWHDVKGYFEADRIGRYTVGADNKLRFNPGGRQFDTAIFMDCSQCPVHPELGQIFHQSAKAIAAASRSSGVRPVFFMSWGYKDQPGMTARVAEQYVKAGNDNRVLVIPAGLAFERAMKARPSLELYMPDNRHPTLPGTYLAAATVYASLTGRSVADIGYTAGLDAEVAQFLRQTAQDTVHEFVGRKD